VGSRRKTGRKTDKSGVSADRREGQDDPRIPDGGADIGRNGKGRGEKEERPGGRTQTA